MSRRLLSAHLVVVSALCGVANGGEPRLVDEVMADPETFAVKIEAQIRRSDGNQASVLRHVADDLTNSSEWRFHPRDRGLLVAIPVKRNLLYHDKYAGEGAIIDIAERLIRQRDLSGRIDVVFIEPASAECYIRSPRSPGCGAMDALSGCGCR